MDSIYLEKITKYDNKYLIESFDSISHIKAFRLKSSESIMVSNGLGFAAEGLISVENNKYYFIKKNDFEFNFNENKLNLSILIGSLENRDRMEFAIEKCVELGISNIIICKTKYSSNKNYNINRLKQKIIAAFEQSKRSVLPNLRYIDSLKVLDKDFNFFAEIYIADVNGSEIYSIDVKPNSLVMIGPEGGFSSSELDYLGSLCNSKKFKLSHNRLRTETAAISAICLINYKLFNQGY